MKYFFFRNSCIFCAFIVLIFIVNTAVIVLAGELVKVLEIACQDYFLWLIIAGWVWAILLPFIFFQTAKNAKELNRSMVIKLWAFNFLEILCIQIAAETLLSSPAILCYHSDGQNGMEMIIGAGAGAVFVLLYSLGLDYLKNRRNDDSNLREEQEMRSN